MLSVRASEHLSRLNRSREHLDECKHNLGLPVIVAMDAVSVLAQTAFGTGGLLATHELWFVCRSFQRSMFQWVSQLKLSDLPAEIFSKLCCSPACRYEQCACASAAPRRADQDQLEETITGLQILKGEDDREFKRMVVPNTRVVQDNECQADLLRGVKRVMSIVHAATFHRRSAYCWVNGHRSAKPTIRVGR